MRPSSDRKRLEGLNISYLIGNVLSEKDVARAFENQKFDAVISSLAKVGQEPNPHAIGGRNLTKWAKKKGVKHFILISSLGAGPEPVFTKYKEILQAKGEAETALTSSGIDYTIIRTGIILYEEEPATGNAKLIHNQNVIGTITRKDLAQLTAECVFDHQCINQVYNAVDCSLNCQVQ
ncbi:MAG: NAD dependent epimerase/dehydratase [Gammaproteobacteria bacterium]|nr:MAG: NAD dependent epimerase/dehydratase [Gammaproteobacteria bacterium]